MLSFLYSLNYRGIITVVVLAGFFLFKEILKEEITWREMQSFSQLLGHESNVENVSSYHAQRNHRFQSFGTVNLTPWGSFHTLWQYSFIHLCIYSILNIKLLTFTSFQAVFIQHCVFVALQKTASNNKIHSVYILFIKNYYILLRLEKQRKEEGEKLIIEKRGCLVNAEFFW